MFSADVEINGKGYYFETRADDLIEALEAICAQLRRDFEADFKKKGWRH